MLSTTKKKEKGPQQGDLPEGFMTGKPPEDSDSFFHSIATCFHRFNPELETDINNRSLRTICKNYVERGMTGDDDWFVKALKRDYMNEIDKSGANIFGRSEVEGRIICKEYKINLHVVQTNGDRTACRHKLISENEVKDIEYADYIMENVIHIIDYGNNQFAPILRKAQAVVEIPSQANSAADEEDTTKSGNQKALLFNKRPGTAGISGQLYEIQLSMYFMLLGSTNENIKQFRLATNMLEAGDFDDVVFSYSYNDTNGNERKHVIFLQAKHRDKAKKEISIEVLLSEADKGDFLLKKYFKSYLDIKKEFLEGTQPENHPIFSNDFQDCDFIILTNALFTVGELEKQNIRRVPLSKENVLNFKQTINNQYIQLILGGNKEKKIIENLKYSSDCRRLSKDLADIIQSRKVVDLNKPLIKEYHQALAENVFRQTDAKKGVLNENFLRNTCLKSENQVFRNVFVEEIKKTKMFQNRTEEDIIDQLIAQEINLHEKFGKYDSKLNGKHLPNDSISEPEIKEFLQQLKIMVEQPNLDQLTLIIKQKIQEKFKVPEKEVDSVFSDVEYKVREWWKLGNNYLTERDTYFEESAKVSIKFEVREPVLNFTGRVDELKELYSVLHQGGEIVVSQTATVTGLGGIGKTELVRKYIKEHSDSYCNNIIWINAESHTTASESFRRLAKDKLKMNVKDENKKEKRIESIVEDVYKYLENRTSLFVFDNASRFKSLKEGDEGIDVFLPKGSIRPHVLITSRDQEWGSIYSLTLNVFNEQEAFEYVVKSLPNTQLCESDVKELINTLQYLPLALNQAVTYIRKENEQNRNWTQTEFTIRKYLESFQKEASVILDSIRSDGRYTDTVATTWKMTTQRIGQKVFGKQAIEMLDLMAFLAPDRIPVESIFSQLLPMEEELRYAVGLLDQYSMVTLDHGMLTIHRLVQHVTRIEIENKGRSEEVIGKTYQLLHSCYPHDNEEVDNYPLKKLLLPHLEQLLQLLEELKLETAEDRRHIQEKYIKELLVWLGGGYTELGNARREKEIYERAVLLQETIDGPLSYPLGITLLNLSQCYGFLGNPKEQLRVADRASVIMEHNHGKDYFMMAKVFATQGLAYLSIGDPHKAMSLLEKTLSIQEKHYGPDHVEVGKTLDNLGAVYNQLRDFQKQKTAAERVLPILEKNFGPNHYELGIALTNLAQLERVLGSPLVAKTYCDRALTIFRTHFDAGQLEIGAAQIILGIICGNLGQYEEGKKVLEEALIIYEEHYGKDNFHLEEVLVSLGAAYGRLGETDNQMNALNRALKLQEEHFGLEHYNVSRTLVNISNGYAKLGQHEESIKRLQRALEISQKHDGPDRLDTSVILLNLSGTFANLGNFRDALETGRKALEIQEKFYGPDHFQMVGTLTVAARAYGMVGNFNKQRELLNRSYTISKAHYGPDNIRTAYSLCQLGDLEEALGNHTQRKQFIEEALSIMEKHFKVDHPDYGKALKSLADVYGDLGEHEKERTILERVYRIFVNCRFNIGDIVKIRERIDEINSLTTLQSAIVKGDLDHLRPLINSSNVFVRSKNMCTALHYSAIGMNPNVTSAVINRIKEECMGDEDMLKEHLNSLDVNGKTPLMYAAAKRKIECLEILLDAGCDPLLLNMGGETVCHIAVKCFSYDIISILKTRNVNINVKDRDDKTPLDYIQEYITLSGPEVEHLHAIRDILKI